MVSEPLGGAVTLFGPLEWIYPYPRNEEPMTLLC